VQLLPSSQSRAAPPTHAPPAQASFVVQALPSSHAAELFVWMQPVAGLHESSVHPFPSSQLGADPPAQTPLAQVSVCVQALPSSQADPSAFAGFEHAPVAVSQLPARWH
jgi:hypothetical protein